MAEKSIITSKTFWVAVFVTILAILNEVTQTIPLGNGSLATIMSIIMIVLRVITKEAVNWKFWE